MKRLARLTPIASTLLATLALSGCAVLEFVGLPTAEKDNIATSAMATRPLDPSFRVVLRSDFARATRLLDPSNDAAAPDIERALAANAMANNPWTTGVVASGFTLGRAVSGSLWVVADDLSVARNGFAFRLLASKYELVSARLFFSDVLVGDHLSFTIKPDVIGYGRCCGPEMLCDVGPDGPPGGCPDGICGNVDFVRYSGAGLPRLSLGLPNISTSTYSFPRGFSSTQCHPLAICQNVTPMCSDALDFDSSRTWDVNVPNGSGGGGGCSAGDRPVHGRQVPVVCTYANVRGQEPGAVPGSMPAECDGRCIDCEGASHGSPPSDATLRARQCSLANPVEGSGVCQGTSASVQLEQAALRAEAGIPFGQSGRGACVTSNDGFRSCIACTATTCHREIDRLPLNADAPQGCSATQETACADQTGATPTSAIEPTQPAGAQPLPSSSNAVQVDSTTPPPTVQIPGSPKVPRTAQPPTDTQEVGSNSAEVKPTRSADPVRMSDGGLELRKTDLYFEGAERPLAFTRLYNSRSRGRSEMGSNWTHNWDIRLIPLNDSNRPVWADPFCSGAPGAITCLLLHTPDGDRLFSYDMVNDVFVPQAGITATLRSSSNRMGWHLLSADGHVMKFDAGGWLVEDIDRFGNGFTLEWELSASGALFDALCPLELSVLNGQAGTYDTPVKPGGFSAMSLECALLGGLIGQRAPYPYSPSNTAEFLPPVPASLLDARDLIALQQRSPGRQLGSASPSGQRSKRLSKVSEIRTRDASGQVASTWRSLKFIYWPDNDRTLVDGSPVLPHAGLLRSIQGPAGAMVEFEYATPESQGHPAWLNEVLLTRVTRADAPTGMDGLSPTPRRVETIRYAWGTNAPLAAQIADAGQRYERYLRIQTNCTYHFINTCGQAQSPGFQFTDIPAAIANYTGNLLSDAVDNIIRIDNDGVIESETRYEMDVFSNNYDRVVKQRYGSSTAVGPPPEAGDFDSLLPEARLTYVSAGSVRNGRDDATSAFLDAALAARYPLEAISDDIVETARAKGALVEVFTLPYDIPGRLVPIAEGEFVPQQAAAPYPACQLANLPFLKSQLAGYRASFDYFTRSIPARRPDAFTWTDGVDPDARLLRSRLSCEALANAQSYNVATSDLQSTWHLDAGTMTATPLRGWRAVTNADANRICSWTKLIDRDGDIHVYGLNFQGRQLVQGVLVDAKWKISENLFNADGNVISQRAVTEGSDPWTRAAGDVLTQYADLTADGKEILPANWMRRANVVRTVERPLGTSVLELSEDTGGTFLSAGRYVDYQYEPIFNQLMRVEAGSIDSAGALRVARRSVAVFDYQEAGIEHLLPTLRWQRSFGYRYPLDAAGDIDTHALENMLAVRFGLGDVNGDGLLAGTSAGLPSEVRVTGTGARSESTFYRWAPNGRPNTVISPDGRIARFDYFPLGTNVDASPMHGGALARIRQNVRASWPLAEGPPRAPCTFLPGPWQWLLPASCGPSGLSSQLQTLRHLPAQVADRIAASMTPGSAGDVEFEYFDTGSLRTLRGPRTRVTTFARDLDGRPLRQLIFAGGAPFSSRVIEYDPAMRPRRETTFDADGLLIGALNREFDEEGHVLFECTEFWPSGCDHGPLRGSLPADGQSMTRWFSAEGNLVVSQDAEGTSSKLVLDARKWPRIIFAVSPRNEVRTTLLTYDDAGHNLNRTTGAPGAEQLTESSTFDGYGRVATVKDTQGRLTQVKHSWRGFVSRVEEFGTGIAVLRTSNHEFDEFSRPTAHSLNGVELSRIYRGEGGTQFARKDLGRRKLFSTLDAEGATAWMEDEGEEFAMLHVGDSGSDVSGSSALRRFGVDRLTTSVVNKLDVSGSIVASSAMGDPTVLGGSGVELVTTFVRRPDGLPRKVIPPNLTSLDHGYDLAGRLRWTALRRSFDDPSPETIFFGYDRMGRLTSVVDPKLETTIRSYTPFGDIASVMTPGGAGVVSSFSYDSIGRPSVEGAGSGRIHYEYDSHNRVENIWSAVGEHDLLWSRADADRGLWVLERHFDFDALGRLREATNLNPALQSSPIPVPPASRPVRTTLGYDSLGRLSTESSVIGLGGRATTASTLTPWVDVSGGSGFIRHVTRPDGIVSDEYVDSLGRLVRSTRNVSSVSSGSSFSYLGDLLSVVRADKAGSPLTVSIARDGFGRESARSATLTDVDAAGMPLRPAEGQVVCAPWEFSCARPVVRFGTFRDMDGRIGTSARIDVTPTLQGEQSQWRGYLYDALGRLSNTLESARLPLETLPAGSVVTSDQVLALGVEVAADDWRYAREPVVGTLLSIASATGARSPRLAIPAIKPGYRAEVYSAVDGEPRALGYDKLGRIEIDGSTRYRWDAFSALSSIQRPSTPTEGMQYDAFGRLAARWIDDRLQSNYRYDGLQMVAADDGRGAVQWSAFWGAGMDNLLGMRVAGEELLPVHDDNGNAVAWVRGRDSRMVAGSSFTPEGRASVWGFDASGNRLGQCTDGVTVPACPRPFGIPFDFQSAFRESSSGLLYFRNRWYSPLLTSWLSLDPRGSSDSSNRYAFEAFDSVNRRDPMGLESSGSGVPGPGASEAEWERYALTLNDDIIVVTAPREEGQGASGSLQVQNGYIGDGISIPVLQSATPMSTASPGSSPPNVPGQPQFGKVNVGATFARLDPLLLQLILSGNLGAPIAKSSDEFSQGAVARALGKLGTTDLDGTAERMERLALWHIRLDNDYAASTGTLPVQPRTTQDTLLDSTRGTLDVMGTWATWAGVGAVGPTTWGNTSRNVFAAGGKVGGRVEQYALTARKPGYFPVMQRGSRAPVAWQYLEEGEVWKYGTTRNPFSRYTQLFLDRLRPLNLGDQFAKGRLEYVTEFRGSEALAREQEFAKLWEYFEENFHLPPGNKMFK